MIMTKIFAGNVTNMIVLSPAILEQNAVRALADSSC